MTVWDCRVSLHTWVVEVVQVDLLVPAAKGHTFLSREPYI
jgi:hypothetical protein